MEISNAVVQESVKTIDNAFGRISHCIDQLTDEHIWVRENEHVNSIGIILKHLCGNLRQWVISGIGGLPDIRNRSSEFIDDEILSKNEVMEEFRNIIEESKITIRKLTPEQLLEQRRIQGFDVTILGALYDTIPHLELHAGQIVYISRILLKGEYKLRWKPTTKEEGSE